MPGNRTEAAAVLGEGGFELEFTAGKFARRQSAILRLGAKSRLVFSMPALRKRPGTSSPASRRCSAAPRCLRQPNAMLAPCSLRKTCRRVGMPSPARDG